MSVLYGPPPKFVWLAMGNASTREIERLLRVNAGLIGTFIEEAESGLLVLRP